jgi:hypothetical protein
MTRDSTKFAPAQDRSPNPEAWLAGVNFTEIDSGGLFMTVKFKLPRLDRTGSLTLHADLRSIAAPPGNPINAAS